MEILRDPIWQFWGALLALVGIVSGIAIYILQRKKKSLSYEILTSGELLTANEELRGRIRILFDKKPVQNLHLLVIRIKNDGNVYSSTIGWTRVGAPDEDLYTCF